MDERIKACYTKDNKERNLIFKGRFFFEIDIFEKMSSIEFLFFLVGKNDLESEVVFYSLNCSQNDHISKSFKHIDSKSKEQNSDKKC